MSKFKFAVLISGNGSNLGSMIEYVDNNKIKGNICCVLAITQWPMELKEQKMPD